MNIHQLTSHGGAAPELRFGVLASLHFTWDGDDLGAPIFHSLVIGRAPSLVKDALSIGYVEGALVARGHSLEGDLRLTEKGRSALVEFRSKLS